MPNLRFGRVTLVEKGNDCCTRTEPCVKVLVSAVLVTFALEISNKSRHEINLLNGLLCYLICIHSD